MVQYKCVNHISGYETDLTRDDHQIGGLAEWQSVSQHGARCRDCSWCVSPCYSPSCCSPTRSRMLLVQCGPDKISEFLATPIISH